ncbi:MAG: LicD family protein [Marinifilaceae bacterium]
MPTIKIDNFSYQYQNIPLYHGRKQINKTIAKENLQLFHEIMQKHNLTFGLIYGTLLGVIRDGDFISHDEDIDLFMLEENQAQFIKSLPSIEEYGFKVARYDKRGLISIIRNNEYIDIYFFHKDGDIRNCCGERIPAYILDECISINFIDKEFLIPKDYMNFFIFEYGKTWNIPIVYKTSFINRAILKMNSILKDILPNSIASFYYKQKDIKLLNNYHKKLQRIK